MVYIFVLQQNKRVFLSFKIDVFRPTFEAWQSLQKILAVTQAAQTAVM